MSDDSALPVITEDGMRGAIVDGAPEGDTSRVLVRFESGRQVLVPRSALALRADGRSYRLVARLDELERAAGALDSDGTLVVPVAVEELDVQRRQVETGRVRIAKRVHEREETVDEPLIYEDVDIERVPVNQVVERELEPRTEGDTLIIPVLEEMLVVTKQLVLREELRITLRRTSVRRQQQVTLRSEEVQVEREAGGGTDRATQGTP